MGTSIPPEWPCRLYCGSPDCLRCTYAAAREVEARQRQLEAYAQDGIRKFTPWTSAARAAIKADVLTNIRVAPAGSPMSGQEVDALVAGYGRADANTQWAPIEERLRSITWARAGVLFGERPTRDEVDELVQATLLKALRAIAARRFLAIGAPPTLDALWAAHHCFTHVFPFRPWLWTVLTNELRDAAVARARRGGSISMAVLAQLPAPVQPVNHAVVIHHVPKLLELIAVQHARGERRAEHMRHLLARLPRRSVQVIDLRYPGLAIAAIPVARSDAEMAANLGTSVSNVESTRSNYKTSLARKHPELVPAFALVCSMARLK